MRNYILPILTCLTSVILSSCSESVKDFVPPVPSSPSDSSYPVSFSALAKRNDAPNARLTEDGNSTSFTAGDAIGVFAYHNGSTTPNFMNNQKVTFNGNTWTYEPLKYWPEEDFLTFYAYYPQDSNADFMAIDNTSNKFSFTYTNRNLDYDLMVSDKMDIECTSRDAVVFQMKHLMAKVKFTFSYANSSDEVEYEPVVHMVEFGGVPYSGVFAFDFDNGNQPQWKSIDLDHTTMVKRFTNDVNGVIITDGEKEIPEFAAYLLPGSVVSGQFDVSINNQKSSYTLPDSESFAVERGKTYNLRFNIKKTESGHYFIASYSLWENGGDIDGELQ